MEFSQINTREDLDSLVGTPRHDEAMAMLAGTLWRLQKDDATKTWSAVEDESTIARFGFTRADFPNATAPALPAPDAPPNPKVAIQAQINALFASAGITQDWQLKSAMAALLALATTQGVSETTLYADNPGYKQVKDLMMEITTLQAQMAALP